MRRSLLAVGAIVATVGLASCSSGSTKATIDQYVASFGAQPYAQLHLTLSAGGVGSAKAQSVLKQLSMDMRFASTSGSSLSSSAGAVNTEVLVNIGASPAVDLREVDGNVYLRFDLSGLSAIPGINVTQSQIATVQLLLGNRWFEIPKSLVNAIAPSSTAQQHKAAADRVLGQKFVDALSNLIVNSKITSIKNGYATSGSIQSVVDAIAPVIHQAHAGTSVPTHATGSYALTLTASGSTVTGGSVSIIAPGGAAKGNATLKMTVSHDTVTITAPSGATVVTPQLIAQLRSGGGLG